MQQLHHEIDRSPDGTTVRLSGEVDLRVSGQMLDALATAIYDDAPGRVVVDLHRVTLLDSTGVGALLTAQKLAAGCGRQFSVQSPQGMVRRVLEMTGVLAILTGPQ